MYEEKQYAAQYYTWRKER